jgi:hypothetical protein
MLAAFGTLAAARDGTAKRANELRLGRLRPGRSTLADAKTIYGEKRRFSASDDGKVWTWADPCAKSKLLVEADEQGVIQTLTLSNDESVQGDCFLERSGAAPGRYWKTGRGLALGDPRQKVVDLYGPPNSTSPSVRGARELELLFYAFDWVGSDVPQVMEVTCDHASGRVVEITLAFPSL